MKELTYPYTRKEEIYDDFNGISISDPYRWLESHHGEELDQWIDEQNNLVNNYIDDDVRIKFEKRFSELLNYTRYTAPVVRTYKGITKYFYTKNDGLQPQDIIYMRKGINGKEQQIFDPNTLSDDGTVSVSMSIYSHDAKYLALAISESGSDWQIVKILDLDTKKFLEDKIENIRNESGLEWMKDNSGFYYSAYVGKEDTVGAQRFWWHTLNTDTIMDKMVFEHPDDTELAVFGGNSIDEKYQFIMLTKSTMPRNMLYYRRLDLEGEFKPIVDELIYEYQVLDVHNDLLIVRTNNNADNGRIIGINLNNPSKENWIEIVPESDKAITGWGGVIIANDHLFITYLDDVKHLVKIYDLSGNYVKDLKLPDMGSVDIFGKKDQKDLFIVFTSFYYSTTVYSYDIEKNELVKFFDEKNKMDLSQLESKQIFFSSKDGTKIPMFILNKKGVNLDGNNHMLLYGYGGFNISLSPVYSSRAIAWIEQGGIYAIANLRGGGEYGEKWHKGGMLDNKQNVFDDFISAAEWLIDNKYTNTKKLAIIGGSNGGLLTAACMNQRPDLYGAVISIVGVLDMLRYHKFTIGRYWIPEYGDPMNPEHFKILIKYSPLHNVKDVKYPPLLIHTADTDDRVDPGHSKKFAATIQEKGKGGPLLLRIVKKAGHGAGKPITKLIEDMAYELAFIFKALEI